MPTKRVFDTNKVKKSKSGVESSLRGTSNQSPENVFVYAG